MEDNDIFMFNDELNQFSDCRICPHNCGINRFISDKGWCHSYAGLYVASIIAHKGEEPIISGTNGIVNVFFMHCNLQCIFCQNHQISSNRIDNQIFEMNFDVLINKIKNLLKQGCHAVGFVSPSHMIPHVKRIIKTLRQSGENCTFIYNSNGFDSVESLKSLEGLIDVYLPDFKYLDKKLAASYSKTPSYPQIASLAIKEMYRQKGSSLHTNQEGLAISGLIIRHLVLPNHIDNTKSILKFIAEEISPRVHVSLMSQYYPVYKALNHKKLGRVISAQEYNEVIAEMENSGLFKGWIQELDSPENYLPDFNKASPFEKESI